MVKEERDALQRKVSQRDLPQEYNLSTWAAAICFVWFVLILLMCILFSSICYQKNPKVHHQACRYGIHGLKGYFALICVAKIVLSLMFCIPPLYVSFAKGCTIVHVISIWFNWSPFPTCWIVCLCIASRHLCIFRLLERVGFQWFTWSLLQSLPSLLATSHHSSLWHVICCNAVILDHDVALVPIMANHGGLDGHRIIAISHGAMSIWHRDVQDDLKSMPSITVWDILGFVLKLRSWIMHDNWVIHCLMVDIDSKRQEWVSLRECKILFYCIKGHWRD